MIMFLPPHPVGDTHVEQGKTIQILKKETVKGKIGKRGRLYS